ncbi:MAG: SIS domain-containing protein [Candidatus Anstonellales archaeon]
MAIPSDSAQFNSEQSALHFFSELKKALDGVSLSSLLATCDEIFNCWKRGGVVYVMGNGGSGATASHFVCDLSKWTASEGKLRIKAISLNENMPLISAISNDIGFDAVYVEQLKNYDVGKNDILIGFSTLGSSRRDKRTIRSNNLIEALKYAKSKGAKTIGFIGFDGGLMKDFCDISIIVPVNSVIHTESVHVCLCHFIAQNLKQRINSL